MPPKTKATEPEAPPAEDVKAEGAKPEEPAAEQADASDPVIEHPHYGQVKLSELTEILRAELQSEQKQAEEAEAAKLPDLCEEHFPQGWDSKNALGQDGVGCEHGSWNRKRPTR